MVSILLGNITDRIFMKFVWMGQKPRKMESCSLCLIKPRCGCAVESDYWFIPPSINGCEKFQEMEIAHPVNLMIPAELNELIHDMSVG